MAMRSIFVLLALVSVAGLQTRAQDRPPAPKPPADGSTVTVTGCLRAGGQPGSFLLTGVRWESRSPTTPGGAAGHHDQKPAHQPPAKPDATSEAHESKEGETLRLAGIARRQDLQEHAGHTVTITGMLAREDRIVTPGIILPDAPRTGDPKPRKPEVSGKNGPRVLNVRSVTRVSEGCK